MKIKSEHHGISVSDLDRSVKWYSEVFGLKEEKRFEKEELEIRGALMKKGNCVVEILCPYKPEVLPHRVASLPELLRATGSNHFALSVDDIKSFFKDLDREQVNVVTGLIDGRFFFIQDPDQTLIEVRQA